MTLAEQMMVDAPFRPPLECQIDLPFPPSTNDLWSPRRQRGQLMLTKAYKDWKALADKEVVVNGSWRQRVRLPGNFTADVLLSNRFRTSRTDSDNRIKAVLDWAQSRELVHNDALCDGGHWRWVHSAEAPAGCRLILRSVA
jgi:Holliday junction resolvase RusA-like endonuclease